MDALVRRTGLSQPRRAVLGKRVGIWVHGQDSRDGRIKVHHLTGHERLRVPHEESEWFGVSSRLIYEVHLLLVKHDINIGPVPFSWLLPWGEHVFGRNEWTAMTGNANISELGIVAQWLSDAHGRIRNQVIVRTRAAGSETGVAIDHRLPCDLERHAGWHVHTRATFLPRDHFSSQVRFKIKTAAATRGRAMFCHDLDEQEVVAVMSYHLDESTRVPILITALGFRMDAGAHPLLGYRSLAGALVLKHHLHAVAYKVARGGFVDMDLANRADLELARELGFRRAPSVKGFRPSGLLLRQQSPVQDVGRGE